MPFDVSSLANRMAYGCVSEPTLPRAITALANYASTVYFLNTFEGTTMQLIKWLSAVLTLTFLGYAEIDYAMGISTISSFLYGYKKHYTWVDHCLYWSFSAVPVIDLVLQNTLSLQLLPFPQRYTYLAISAHSAFALFGYVVKT